MIKLSFCWNTWNFSLFLGHISAPNLFYISKITLFLVYFFLLVLTIFLPGSLYRSLHLFFVYLNVFCPVTLLSLKNIVGWHGALLRKIWNVLFCDYKEAIAILERMYCKCPIKPPKNAMASFSYLCILPSKF